MSIMWRTPLTRDLSANYQNARGAHDRYATVQRPAAVTAYSSSEHLLLFAFAGPCSHHMELWIVTLRKSRL